MAPTSQAEVHHVPCHGARPGRRRAPRGSGGDGGGQRVEAVEPGESVHPSVDGLCHRQAVGIAEQVGPEEVDPLAGDDPRADRCPEPAQGAAGDPLCGPAPGQSSRGPGWSTRRPLPRSCARRPGAGSVRAPVGTRPVASGRSSEGIEVDVVDLQPGGDSRVGDGVEAHVPHSAEGRSRWRCARSDDAPGTRATDIPAWPVHTGARNGMFPVEPPLFRVGAPSRSTGTGSGSWATGGDLGYACRVPCNPGSTSC